MVDPIDPPRRPYKAWVLPIFFYAALLLIGGFSPNLYAQALPTLVLKDKVLTGKDTQELLRRQEHQRRLRQQQEHTLDVHLSNEDKAQAAEVSCKLPTSETPCFPIELIVLNGEESHRFAWALQAAHRPDDPPIAAADNSYHRHAGRLSWP